MIEALSMDTTQITVRIRISVYTDVLPYRWSRSEVYGPDRGYRPEAQSPLRSEREGYIRSVYGPYTDHDVGVFTCVGGERGDDIFEGP